MHACVRAILGPRSEGHHTFLGQLKRNLTDGKPSNTALHLPHVLLCIQAMPMLKLMRGLRQEQPTLSQMWRLWLVS
jgi:hypothetical protein